MGKMLSMSVLGQLLAVSVVCSSAQHYDGQSYYNHGSNYEFQYEVNDPYHHDFKAQSETNIGGVVKGFYKLKEKDGSTREVVYTADKHSGFRPVVYKDGNQVYPEIVTKAQYAIPVHRPAAYQPQPVQYQQVYQSQPVHYQPAYQPQPYHGFY